MIRRGAACLRGYIKANAGYVSQLPEPRLPDSLIVARVSHERRPRITKREYNKWFKATYGVEHISDGANTGPSAKSGIAVERGDEAILTQLDAEAVDPELRMASMVAVHNEFSQETLTK